MGKEGGGRRRARAPGHARKRAQAQPPLPDRLALPPLSGKSSRPDTPESNGEGDWAFWLSIRPVSLPLAAGEKAGRPSSARACRLRAIAEDAIGGGRARGRSLPVPASPPRYRRRRRRHRRPQPPRPPPFHHGRVCVVWGEAGPPCPPVARTASTSPLGAGSKGTSLPSPSGPSQEGFLAPASGAGLLLPPPPEAET